MDTFYQLHVQTRRRQGVPVQPRRFFRLLWENTISTGLGSVLIVEASAQPIAAAVFLAWNETVIYKFGASDASACRCARIICSSGTRSARPASRGIAGSTSAGLTSARKGLRNFKLSWGAAEEPLVYGTLGGRPGPASPAEGMAARMLGPVIRHGPLLLCRAFGETLYRYVA